MPVQTEFGTPTANIKSKGFFIWKDVLATIKDWLDSEYYDFLETKHKYKPDEREVEIVGERKLNEYVKYKINIALLAQGLKDVEVIKEGKKITMQEGRIKIEVTGNMTLDWQKRFGGNAFLQAVQDFYHKYIIKQKIETEWLDHLLFKIFKLTKVLNEKLGTTT